MEYSCVCFSTHQKWVQPACTACMHSHAGSAPLHEFWVSRVKLPAEFWAGGKTREGAEDGVGRFGGYQRRARLLSLTEAALVEKGADAKRVSRLHDLAGVAALVCFELACESRYFAIEWSDGSLPGVYESNRRQRDLALLLEQTQVRTVTYCYVLGCSCSGVLASATGCADAQCRRKNHPDTAR